MNNLLYYIILYGKEKVTWISSWVAFLEAEVKTNVQKVVSHTYSLQNTYDTKIMQ